MNRTIVRLPLLALALPLALGGAGPRAARAAGTAVVALTTTTDLADVVRRVGGDAVAVESLCKGPEDPHFLDARPTFLQAMRRAELVVVTGMGLEDGYLPLLLREAGNPGVRPGGAGYVDASARIRKLGVPTGPVTRAMGDVHAAGNPHYLLDPANAGIVAEDVAKALSALRPDGAAGFSERATALRRELSDLLLGAPSGPDGKGARAGGYLERFRPYRGAGVVGYHANLEYLCERLGLSLVGSLEPKPGVPPTAAHVASLAERARGGAVRIVARNVFQPEGPVASFAAQTGAQAVLIAHQPGATPDAPDLLSMHRRNLDALLRALEATAPR